MSVNEERGEEDVEMMAEMGKQWGCKEDWVDRATFSPWPGVHDKDLYFYLTFSGSYAFILTGGFERDGN